MKTKIFTLVIVIIGFMASFTQANAQKTKETAIEIKKFEPGKPISQGEFDFLQFISETKSRGNEVIIGKSKITVGKSISADEAQAMNARVKAYTQTHKSKETLKDGSSSRGWCCSSWQLFCCDVYGNWYRVCTWWVPC